MTVKSVGAIFLFAFVYLLLVCCAIALTIGCGILGYTLVAYNFSGYSILITTALVSVGLLTLVFLFKFIFKKHVTDLAHLVEVRKEQEPELFQMVEALVGEIGTDFPKKIYLSADVNAAVFYDSGFWSMFLPVRKNLQIGLGMVNAVSVTELRAILAHEFGHFSQKTMKVGSYVYHMNRVIYNMLYDNDAFETLIEKWASSNTFLAIGVIISVKIVRGIQWILKQVYHLLNITYLDLSREMEFHADEIAARVTGSGPLSSSLLRLEFAAQAYQIVLNYYQEKITESKKPGNLYPQQTYVMGFLAQRFRLGLSNGMPQVSLEYVRQHNRSKLVIADQWASHPTSEDRIVRLNGLNIPVQNEDNRPAWCIFKNKEHLQHQLTETQFSSVEYPSPVTEISEATFIGDYVEIQNEFSFDDLFNGYYDNKNPERIALEESGLMLSKEEKSMDDLFGKSALDNMHDYLGSEQDLQILRGIVDGHYAIKTFDYDGIKYTANTGAALTGKLELRQSQLKELITENDLHIYRYFLQKETQLGRQPRLNGLYAFFYHWDALAETYLQVYTDITNAAAFMFDTTPEKQIDINMAALKTLEITFKESIKNLIAEEGIQDVIDAGTRRDFETYLSENNTYFHDQQYKEAEVQTLITCINNYHELISKAQFKSKKKLLDYQAQLAKENIIKDNSGDIAQPPVAESGSMLGSDPLQRLQA